MSETSLEEVATVDETGVNDAALIRALNGEQDSVAACRALLAKTNEDLARRFRASEPIETLVEDRARAIDHIIQRCWETRGNGIADSMDLVAVGGYGRGELHPGSDIDLLILHDSENVAAIEGAVAGFLTFLWDIGLEVGQSVRTLADCQAQAKADLSVMTTLLESRLIAGSGRLFAQLSEYITGDNTWDSAAFFNGKVEEQRARHLRYHDTAHNLEPNLKSSPGGLRDIQILSWIARRHYGFGSLEKLVEVGLLTAGQLRILRSSQAFLWRIRFALHLLTGRREDRILFDHQIKLAEMLGYEDASYTLAVEQMMQRYYRTVMEVSRINEMTLQQFEEVIIGGEKEPERSLGPNFQVRNGYIEAVSDDVFARDPSTLLEIFLLLENNTELRGIAATTIALIKQHLWLIDEGFRQDPRHHRLFLDILRAPIGVSRTLRRMNTYGVLGLYVPAFGRIVGRMQYDLFHAYTVDAHTLFVVENLRRLSLPEFSDDLPHVSQVMQQLDKPEIVYLAGLFHDIAKGRGGDHSELGAVDAEAFCLEHGMSRYEAHLVAWLVKQHLTLSVTAQKKDLNDPNVILEFARIVGDRIHLEYLYVLTVADVRGTNPSLWNSWKDSLFWELYQATLRTIRRGFSNPIDQDELIEDRQAAARKLLHETSLPEELCRRVWTDFTQEYFLRHRPAEIAWHTQILADSQADESILVSINSELSPANTLVTVYAPQDLYSFARTTAVLDDFGLDIVDARIVPLENGRSIDTFTVLDANGKRIEDARTLERIRTRILRALQTSASGDVVVSRRVPRVAKAFNVPVEVDFSREATNERTVVGIVAGDRPGLLSQIGEVFEQQGVFIQAAKISTIGERAEDVFFITTSDAHPLTDAECETLGEALSRALKQSS
ncbi:MAG: [protein-PII] uridylyltransferase [Gammaproteobacteria bacterium]